MPGPPGRLWELINGGLYNGSILYTPTVSGSFFCDNRPDEITGGWKNGGGNCIGTSCPECELVCPADVDRDGQVDGLDLNSFLGAWETADSRFDYDDSGLVDGADLLVILGAWGACAP